MTSAIDRQADDPRAALLPRNVGRHGWTLVTWAMAGGIALGGLLVSLMTLSGNLSAYGLFPMSTGLFVVGALIGMAHGGALGYLGRGQEVLPRPARRDMFLAVLYSVPALAVGWLVTIWVAMTVVAVFMGRTAPLVGSAIGWALAAAVLVSAAVLGARAFRSAYAGWPERRAGTLIVAATFAALCVTFLADRPEIWGLRLRLTEVGGLLLAAEITIWVVGPAVTMALRALKRVPGLHPVGVAPGWRGAGDLLVGLTTGVVVGLLVVPFAAPASVPATLGTVVAGVSAALVDEVLLRLILVTGVAWLLVRWHDLHREELVLLSVAAVALLQVILYAPGVIATGFPTALAALAFTATAVLLPAAVFGLLYWKKGFSAAVLADAVYVAVVLILAT